jgi:hypothetical protein
MQRGAPIFAKQHDMEGDANRVGSHMSRLSA